MAIQTVTDAIRYVGVDDNTLALFENQYPVQPMGVSYNSYHFSLYSLYLDSFSYCLIVQFHIVYTTSSAYYLLDYCNLCISIL